MNSYSFNFAESSIGEPVSYSEAAIIPINGWFEVLIKLQDQLLTKLAKLHKKTLLNESQYSRLTQFLARRSGV